MSVKKSILFLFLVSVLFVQINSQDIFDVLRKNDISQFKMLLEKDPDLVNQKDEMGFTPLHYVAISGNKELADLLISKKANVNAKNRDGAIPLLYACQFGKKEIAELLIKNGSEVNTKNQWGATPLHRSVGAGNIEMIDILLNNNAQLNIKDNAGETPLHRGIRENINKEVIDHLIQIGADIQAKDLGGRSPLFASIRPGNKDIFSLLLAKGSELDTKNNSGLTLLHQAAVSGNNDIAKILLEKNARINAKDRWRRTPLDLAYHYHHPDLIETLIKSGAKKNILEKRSGHSLLLHQNLKEKEAVIWYLGHAGWAVKTKSSLLIFDYWEAAKTPSSPLLANGRINPEEIRDLNVYVFVSHSHGDHCDPIIFDWENKLKNIKYFFGWDEKQGPTYICLSGRESENIDQMEVQTVKATDEGVSFLVKIDGLTIFHSGDSSEFTKDLSPRFTAEIDYLSRGIKNIDIAFIYSAGTPTVPSMKYMLRKLSPHAVFPQHFLGVEYLSGLLSTEPQLKEFKNDIISYENRGDRFFYNNGKAKVISGW